MITHLIYMFIILCLFSCEDELHIPPPDDVDNQVTEYEQFGTPFNEIPATQDIIMYEVNLRAYSPEGDLQGVIDKLDHIESLGINVIWLMPIHPIGQVNSVNSPYSVKNYKAVGSEYGDLEDLRTLTTEAHNRGIAIIMDWVANHTSWDNNWIQNKNWYSQDANGNIIHPPGTNWQDVADLNYDNENMREAMIDAMKYWVYEANIDGFRCDYADGVPFDFWKEAWQNLDSIPDRQFIYFAEGTRNDHFDAGFDLNFSWQFYGALKQDFNNQVAGKIIEVDKKEKANTPENKSWVRFTTNHDESAWDATPISLFNGTEGALAASMATIFTGGVPLIYGSQEVGTANNIPFFTNSTINWDNNPKMLSAYQKMLQFYSNSTVAKTGENTVFPHNDILCFKKSFENEEILIITNLRDYTINFSFPPELESSEWSDIMAESTLTLNNDITLAPYQFYILQK
ncbi:alpha-amylase family glycosyl hydrolase [Marivirga sp.]|uniref:alpha-amylase family glycosyl hydrolase n=1 Tax=Marivirga sp. TaxID=2018662 RepID=UPI0025DDFDEA|nr:alpha-amylase family glycosyl hydrolase [Marivirga sp.]